MNEVCIKNRGAVIVTRVSTGEQAKNGTSLESQLDTCRLKALALDLPIVAEYEDAGISGGLLLMREGMQRGIADIKAGRANTLVCANMSRYSRDVEHQQSIRKEVRQAGGVVVFCDMQFDDTPEGDLAFSIMGGFAEYERKVIRARTMSGRQKRIDQGQQPTRGHSPYGYHIVTHADVTRGTYEPEMIGRYTIVPIEANAIRMAFAAYAQGEASMSGVCRLLHASGARPRRAKVWHLATLHDMLNNPVYKGEPAAGRYRYNMDEQRVGQIGKNGKLIKTARALTIRSTDQWTTLFAPSLVDEATWDAVQRRLATNSAKMSGNPAHSYLLTGLPICPRCGAKLVMTGKTTKKGRVRAYICSAYQKAMLWSGEQACVREAFSVEATEAAALKAIQSAAASPEALDAAEQAYLAPRTNSTADTARRELTALDLAIGDLAHEERALVTAQVAGIRAGAPADVYAAAFADLALKRKDMEDRRGQLSARIRQVAGPDFDILEIAAHRKALTDVSMVLGSVSITREEKRTLIRRVVTKVVPRQDGADVYFGSATVKNSSVTQYSPVAGVR